MDTPITASKIAYPAPNAPSTGQPNPIEPVPPLDKVFPPTDTFDILPALHELLSRLLAETQDASRPPTYSNQEPLLVQNLAAQLSVVKNKIRKAREAVQELPDVGRAISEQEAEIQELREKIERQKRVLDGLGEGT